MPNYQTDGLHAFSDAFRPSVWFQLSFRAYDFSDYIGGWGFYNMRSSAADRTVAVGLDGTAEHPLHHAAMTAVSAAAADNRRAWPDSLEGGSGGAIAQESGQLSRASVHRAPGSGAEKRQKQAGCTDVSQGHDLAAHVDASQGTEEAIPPTGERCALSNHCNWRAVYYKGLGLRV